MINAYISIGNSDDKLTQARWADFIAQMRFLLSTNERWQVHGEWYSRPDHPWQNANWCTAIPEEDQPDLLAELYGMAKEFDQDSIAVAFASPRFVGPGGEAA